MKTGDTVRATWTDGEVVVGRYVEHSRGFIILVTENEKKVACDPRAVKFEVIE